MFGGKGSSVTAQQKDFMGKSVETAFHMGLRAVLIFSIFWSLSQPHKCDESELIS